jgi:hypothetical protein
MTTHTWPIGKWVPEDRVFQLKPITQASVSPYTGGMKSSTMGMVWTCEAMFPFMQAVNSNEFQSFLDELEGPTNPVRMFDWRRKRPNSIVISAVEPWSDGTLFSDGTGWGTFGLNLTVSIAAVRGAQTVTISGFNPNQDFFSIGDLIEIGGTLCQVKRAGPANSSGVLEIGFLPGLRVAVPVSTPVVIDVPRVTMRMTPDSLPQIHRMVHAQPFSLTFVEAVDLI